ncbi:hypothetical protein [Streptomyces bottropensis]
MRREPAVIVAVLLPAITFVIVVALPVGAAAGKLARLDALPAPPP